MMAKRMKGRAKKTAVRKVNRPSYKQLFEQEQAARGQDIRNFNSEIAKLRAQAFRWRSADGRMLTPNEMDEAHLRNTISFLQRRLVYAFGNSAYLDQTAHHVEALNAMLKEAKTRGLRV